MSKNTFHAARLEKSIRLRRVLAVLRGSRRSGITTLALNELAHSTRGSSDVSELRANGFVIECRPGGTTPDGLRIHRYHLQ
jgi:hypothetical protein